jgi:hypothetical protein
MCYTVCGVDTPDEREFWYNILLTMFIPGVYCDLAYGEKRLSEAEMKLKRDQEKRKKRNDKKVDRDKRMKASRGEKNPDSDSEEKGEEGQGEQEKGGGGGEGEKGKDKARDYCCCPRPYRLLQTFPCYEGKEFLQRDQPVPEDKDFFDLTNILAPLTVPCLCYRTSKCHCFCADLSLAKCAVNYSVYGFVVGGTVFLWLSGILQPVFDEMLTYLFIMISLILIVGVITLEVGEKLHHHYYKPVQAVFKNIDEAMDPLEKTVDDLDKFRDKIEQNLKKLTVGPLAALSKLADDPHTDAGWCSSLRC